MATNAATAFVRAVRSNLPGLNRNYDLLPPSPVSSEQYDVESGDGEDRERGECGWRGVLQRRPILKAVLHLTALFLVGSLVLGGTLWMALPPLEEADRQSLLVPTSFDELKALNTLLKKIKLIYPFRTVICFIVTYLYLQAFSLPGSMYLSILAGAVWGVPISLPLCCMCVASGATLCYLISACLGPALFALPKLKGRIELIAQRVDEPGHRENLIPYMIVLRMAPLPPHWALNIACPHLGIGIVPFWMSAFLGIMGVTVIHTTIGGGLEKMTSSEDFHLISWGNFFGLAAIICAVCVPILLRWKWQKELEDIDGSSPCCEGNAEIQPPTRELSTLSPSFLSGRRVHDIPQIVIADSDSSVGSLGLIGVSSLTMSRNEPSSTGRSAFDRRLPLESSDMDEIRLHAR